MLHDERFMLGSSHGGVLQGTYADMYCGYVRLESQYQPTYCARRPFISFKIILDSLPYLLHWYWY
eukprot:4160994-Pleurochrysis_carterae.AAC.1